MIFIGVILLSDLPSTMQEIAIALNKEPTTRDRPQRIQILHF